MMNCLVEEIIEAAGSYPDLWRWRWSDSKVTALLLDDGKTEIHLLPNGKIDVFLHGKTLDVTNTPSIGNIQPALSWGEQRQLKKIFKELVEAKLRRIILKKAGRLSA